MGRERQKGKGDGQRVHRGDRAKIKQEELWYYHTPFITSWDTQLHKTYSQDIKYLCNNLFLISSIYSQIEPSYHITPLLISNL